MKKFFFLVFSFALALQAATQSDKKTVCLNMIVRNEAPVIERCLSKVKDLVDYWVIVDTGSNDGTQKIVQKAMKGVPGELHEQKWVNFGHNRNEALKLAKGKADYVLFIDADEILEGTFSKVGLTADAYLIHVRTSSEPLMTFQRGFMIKNSLDWSWLGVIHEKLDCPTKNLRFETVPNIMISAEPRDGHRSTDPKKHLKDAQVLEQGLIDEPDNADYVYYLAQSYYNAGEYELAMKNYERRAHMSGWEEQTFWSQYYTALLQEHLKMDPQIFIKNYCDAFLMRPTRAEPMCRLAQYYYSQKNYLLGYLTSKICADYAVPNDIIYIEHWMYSWGTLAVFANCALELGKYEEAAEAYAKLVARPNVPAHVLEQAKSTLRWANSKVVETKTIPIY
jgi:glycosyltransferase involved in cell wall biosynthesis